MVLDQLATYLQAAGCGTPGTNLFYPEMPDSPDLCLQLVTFPSEPQEMVLGSRTVHLENMRLQAIQRAATFDAGWNAIKAVEAALVLIVNTTLSGVRYLSVSSGREPSPVGRDENQRWLFTADFDVMKEPG